LDDFGTGYCSLSYLSRLPVDRLKIDTSLISTMTTEKKDAAIVRSIIAIGGELGLPVLAEGVETEQQLETLQALGCDQAQGFLLSPPVPAMEARALLRTPWGVRATPTFARSIEPNG
jgi:EAL domain-containing protein (putative c-di-GMP-specific phosphodiesterase class I)